MKFFGSLTMNDVKIALVLAVCIPACNSLVLWLGLVVGNPLYLTWPAFFVTLLYLIGKERTLRMWISTLLQGLLGILWAYGTLELAGVFAATMPFIGALALAVGIGVFLYAILMGPLPFLFNNPGFLYYLAASCFAISMPAQWAVSSVCLGVIFAVLVFGGIRLLCGFSPIRLTMKTDEELAQEEARR